MSRPAVTIVAAWMSAETGVEPAPCVAPGLQRARRTYRRQPRAEETARRGRRPSGIEPARTLGEVTDWKEATIHHGDQLCHVADGS